MAFSLDQIEDGSGKSGALVYAAESACGDWLAQRGFTAFLALSGSIGSVEKKMIHLLRGTEFVEALGRGRVIGERAVATQRLLFPRVGVEVDGRLLPWTSLPEGWISATFVAAEYSAAGEPLHNVADDERLLTRKRISSAIEKEFLPGQTKVKEFPMIEQLIAPFLRPIGYIERG